MPTLEESIEAVQNAVHEDRFTYLTILESHVTTPGILPTLNEILQNKELTEDIGWDLVDMLIHVDGSEACLETVARLGNPKEVYLKLTQALACLAEAWREDEEDISDQFQTLDLFSNFEEGQRHYQERDPLPKEKIPGAFITLIGMLAVVHQRLRTRFPSLFLGPTLAQILRAYRPTPEMTASVINLVRSLSGRKRPPLPTRTSSISVANLEEDGDSSRNAPDPEPELEDPDQDLKQRKLLSAFVTWILFSYVNDNQMRWSPRLLEKYNPRRNVPGKKTNIDAYREDEELQKKDAVVGQLVALVSDLGVDECPRSFVKSISEAPSRTNMEKVFDDFNNASEDIQLSLGGSVCLIAYWMFSRDVFAAHHPKPEMYIFPDHLKILENFVQEDPFQEIARYAGLTDALLAIGLGLRQRDRIIATDDDVDGKVVPNTMAYHHHLSLILVFHPDIQVRNAATVFAGTVFHAEPDVARRFEILEDLFVNCDYASLKSCGVQWLKEEMIAAKREENSSSSSPHPSPNPFSTPENIDRLQHYVFPDLRFLLAAGEGERDGGEGEGQEPTPQAVLEHWALHGVFLLQAANFAYFLFAPAFRDAAPPGMGVAVEHRFAEPLISAAGSLRQRAAAGWDEETTTLRFAIDRLCDVQFH